MRERVVCLMLTGVSLAGCHSPELKAIDRKINPSLSVRTYTPEGREVIHQFHMLNQQAVREAMNRYYRGDRPTTSGWSLVGGAKRDNERYFDCTFYYPGNTPNQIRVVLTRHIYGWDMHWTPVEIGGRKITN